MDSKTRSRWVRESGIEIEIDYLNSFLVAATSTSAAVAVVVIFSIHFLVALRDSVAMQTMSFSKSRKLSIELNIVVLRRNVNLTCLWCWCRTYFIVASRIVRPSQIFRVAVSILSSPITLSVRASILRNGVDIGSATQECKPGIPETLLIKIPSTTVPGQYRLRVEGNTDRALGGTAFLNETLLNFSQRSMTIFIQTEKPVYHQSQIGSSAIHFLKFPFSN